MKLRKIPLEEFLTVLTDLFEQGVDYIDITGKTNDEDPEGQDIIKITVIPEYMSKEGDDAPEDNIIDLSQGDLENLT